MLDEEVYDKCECTRILCDENRTQIILHMIQAFYILTKDEAIQINSKSFNIVIKEWSNSSLIDSSMRSETVYLWFKIIIEKKYWLVGRTMSPANC